MRLAAAFVMGLAIWFSGGAARAGEECASAVHAQTFVVQRELLDGKDAIGAGVVIARDARTITVATATHVIDGDGPLRILDQTRRAYYEVLARREVPGYDVTLLQLRAQPAFAVVPAQFAPAITGQAISVCGHSGDFWRPASGQVLQASASLEGKEGTRIMIACDACSHGDSGSGVFDADGRLIGILTGQWVQGDGKVVFLEVEPVSSITQERAADRWSVATGKPPLH